MTQPPAAIPAGWYADPWQPGQYRYWDGAAWTPHTSSATATTSAAAGASFDANGSASGMKMGRIAMVLWAATHIGHAAFLLLFVSTFSDFFSSIRDRSETVPELPTWYYALQPISLLLFLTTIAALVLVILWSFRIAQNGRALGIRSSLAPGWAIGGWFIPLANLVLPCMSVAGTMPEGQRGHVYRWWIANVVGYGAASVSGFAMFVVVFGGDKAAAVATATAFAVVIGVAQVLQAVWGWSLAGEIHETHQQLARGGTASI